MNVGMGNTDQDIFDPASEEETFHAQAQLDNRRTGIRRNNFDVQPANILANPGAEGFGHGLLRGKTAGVVHPGSGLGAAVFLFGRQKNPVDKPAAAPRQRFTEARYVNDIDAHSKNCLASK
ncbi:MAG: hypothetical protein WC299_05395 [Kiritimatiellia bacterium]